MECKFKDILERDMDMSFLEEFTYSNEFCKIFLNKVGIINAELCEIWHSKTDEELGESDMTVIFNCAEKKVALLIEDKIDAIAMPAQPSRYILRGKKGVLNGDYDVFYVFIVAPKQYLDFNEKAKEYPNSVTCEEIREYFLSLNDNRRDFKLAQLNFAIEKQLKGYQVIKNSLVTNFWKKYIEYKEIYYPNLNLVNGSDVKPTNGVWTHFRTNDNRSCIYYKSNKGYVDLTFYGQAENIEIIKSFVRKVVGDYYDKGFTIVKTGKSCAIRKTVPMVVFSKDFDDQIMETKLSFDAVEELFLLSRRLDAEGIYLMLLKQKCKKQR